MGETIKEAVMREVKEETYLDVSTWIIYWVFIPILRDPRGHIVSTIFIGKVSPKSINRDPKTGDGNITA